MSLVHHIYPVKTGRGESGEACRFENMSAPDDLYSGPETRDSSFMLLYVFGIWDGVEWVGIGTVWV